MSARFEIVLPQGGQVPVGESPLTVGRGSSSDIVLADEAVSWHHAQLWVEGGALWVRDLGSRNGTFADDERVVGSARLEPGQCLRVGPSITLKFQALGADLSDVPAFRMRHVEDLSTGVRLLVHSDRFTLGGDPGCDLRVDGWPPRSATILFHANGEVWLGTTDIEAQVVLGETFEVQGRRLRVVEETVDHAATVEHRGHRYPYDLVATMNGPSGPQAVIKDAAAQRQVLITGNRGVLLFVLARQLRTDRDAGLERSEEGWCTTADALVGIWGRGKKGSNHLNVLVHRLRNQLSAAGFDPWFVEKRRGGIRARMRTVEVQ